MRRVGRCSLSGYGWAVRKLFFVWGLLGMAVASEEIEELPALLVLGERETEVPKARSWTAEEIAEVAPLTIDRLLAREPSFSLFRRQSSLFGNPTSAGVSLRQSGASAASRSLVLFDGIPQNDPFGGWVNWARYDESLLGGVSIDFSENASLWGNLAAAGTVRLRSREIEENGGQVRLTAGSHGLRSGAGSYDLVEDDWRFRVALFSLEQEGFYALPRLQRGAIDRRLDLEARGAEVLGQWESESGLRAESRLSFFEEERGNGTALSRNETEATDVSLRLSSPLGERRWEALAYYQAGDFSSQFSAAADDRQSERLALDQFEVPGEGLGGGLTTSWEKGDDTTIGGVDFRFLTGETNETVGTFRSRRAGGRQSNVGAFLNSEKALGNYGRLKLGGRMDYWSLTEGERLERSLSSATTLRDDDLSDRDGWEPSISLSWEWAPAENLRWETGLGSSFRLPNLNELYRPFRVRSDVTEANPGLDPERFHSLRSQLDYEGGNWQLGAGVFYHLIEDAIANVPVTEAAEIAGVFGSLPAGGTGSQRRNVERAQVYGLELRADWEASEALNLRFTGVWSQSEFLDSPGQKLLEGERFAQAPELRLNLEGRYRFTEQISVNAGVEYRGQALDDLLGDRKLPAYWNTRVGGEWQVTEALTVRAQIENLFDEEIIAGESGNGLTTRGQPRAFWLSVGWLF